MKEVAGAVVLAGLFSLLGLMVVAAAIWYKPTCQGQKNMHMTVHPKIVARMEPSAGKED